MKSSTAIISVILGLLALSSVQPAVAGWHQPGDSYPHQGWWSFGLCTLTVLVWFSRFCYYSCCGSCFPKFGERVGPASTARPHSCRDAIFTIIFCVISLVLKLVSFGMDSWARDTGDLSQYGGTFGVLNYTVHFDGERFSESYSQLVKDYNSQNDNIDMNLWMTVMAAGAFMIAFGVLSMLCTCLGILWACCSVSPASFEKRAHSSFRLLGLSLWSTFGVFCLALSGIYIVTHYFQGTSLGASFWVLLPALIFDYLPYRHARVAIGNHRSLDGALLPIAVAAYQVSTDSAYMNAPAYQAPVAIAYPVGQVQQSNVVYQQHSYQPPIVQGYPQQQQQPVYAQQYPSLHQNVNSAYPAGNQYAQQPTRY